MMSASSLIADCSLDDREGRIGNGVYEGCVVERVGTITETTTMMTTT